MSLKTKISKQLAAGEDFSSPLSSGSVTACNLKRGQCKCKRQGFNLLADGVVLRAELCTCVRECLTCFGSCRQEKNGALSFCVEPSPVKIVNAYASAKLPSLYFSASLDQFKNFSGNGRDSMHRLKLWLQKFDPHGGPGLVISGPVGVGKTYLLCAIARFMIEKKGYSNIRFVDFHRLLSVIRAAYSDRKSEEEILNPLIHADILIIDELGKGRNNDWEQEKLDQIVMGRYGQNKVIIASTNYSLKENKNTQSLYNVDLDQMSPRGQFDPDVFESLESRVGKRIFSRLFETSVLLELTGDDFRKTHRRVPHDLQPQLQS